MDHTIDTAVEDDSALDEGEIVNMNAFIIANIVSGGGFNENESKDLLIMTDQSVPFERAFIHAFKPQNGRLQSSFRQDCWNENIFSHWYTLPHSYRDDFRR